MRSRLSKLVQIIPVLFLAGCASQPDINVEANRSPLVCNQTPRVDNVNLADTPPTAVEKDPYLIDEEAQSIQRNPNAEWGWWFDSNGYADLADNLQVLRRHARQLRAVGAYYATCIEQHNAKIAEE